MRLYLDVDGTLLSHIDGTGPDGKIWKEGATDFLEWAIKNFDCYWLTGWAKGGDMSEIVKDLNPFLPESCRDIPAAHWTRLKTEALEREDGQFLWADDAVLHNEWQFLDENGWSANVVLAKANDPSVKAIEAEIKEKMQYLLERQNDQRL